MSYYRAENILLTDLLQSVNCLNSIVVFPSDVPHEVLPVVCGDAVMAGRFTVNGWIGEI